MTSLNKEKGGQHVFPLMDLEIGRVEFLVILYHSAGCKGSNFLKTTWVLLWREDDTIIQTTFQKSHEFLGQHIS